MRKCHILRISFDRKPTRQFARLIDIVNADDPHRPTQGHSDEVTAGTGPVRFGWQTSVHVVQIREHAVVRFGSSTN